jgi:hypothetical protein
LIVSDVSISKKEESKMKIGDRVIAKKDAKGIPENLRGEGGKILSFADSQEGKLVYVRFGTGRGMRQLDTEMLVPAKCLEIASSTDEP